MCLIQCSHQQQQCPFADQSYREASTWSRFRSTATFIPTSESLAVDTLLMQTSEMHEIINHFKSQFVSIFTNRYIMNTYFHTIRSHSYNVHTLSVSFSKASIRWCVHLYIIYIFSYVLIFQVFQVFQESNYTSHYLRYMSMSFPWLIPPKFVNLMMSDTNRAWELIKVCTNT